MRNELHWTYGLAVLVTLVSLLLYGANKPSVPIVEAEPAPVIKEVFIEKELDQNDWLDVITYIAREFKPYGKKVVIEALVISYLEGKWDRNSTNTYNSNGQIDRGYWQIGDKPHPSVSDECARDLVCSTNYAKKLYDRQGWKPWSAGWVLNNFW